MNCEWESYIHILPIWMRSQVDKQYKNTLLQTHLRLGYPPEFLTRNGSYYLDRMITVDDLSFSVNMACKYSPWASATISRGYVTASGGHRVGVCGNCSVQEDKIVAVHNVSSLCVRVARDFTDISADLYKQNGSLLIIGRPGSGKTTLLRDLIRKTSTYRTGSICVVDEKRELFPMYQNRSCFSAGKRTDILSGCNKKNGIEAVLRNMSPSTIAIDEITAAEDCEALVQAGWCGVRLLGTAHAGNIKDFMTRPVYKPIINSGLFDTIVIMQSDKSWVMERME